jgi:hypothetical protein
VIGHPAMCGCVLGVKVAGGRSPYLAVKLSPVIPPATFQIIKNKQSPNFVHFPLGVSGSPMEVTSTEARALRSLPIAQGPNEELC